MATNRQIHGKVVLEVETEGESEALAKLRARFAAVTAKVGVEAGFRRSQLQSNLTAEAGKGRGLRVDVAGVFSRPQLQRALKVATAKPLVANVDAKFSRAQIQRALKEAVAAKPPKITVTVDAKRGTFKAVVSQAEGIQKEITDLEKRHLEQRETDRLRSAARESAIRSKGLQDRLTTTERALRSIEAAENRHFTRLVEYDAAAARRKEVIDAQLQARLEAADTAFRQRRILAAEREQIRLQRLASRPIIQRILVNTDAINASLADFDRTVSRGLRTSLAAFTAWSAGVTIAVTAAATAGVVAFARLETAATNAGAVIATQTRIDELDKFGRAVSDFATVTEQAQQRIEAVSQRVALQTRFDPTEIANGIGALLKAGQTAQEAFTNIGSAAEFASVNAADLTETSEGLAKSLASAGLDADQSALLLDKISVTAAKAVGDVEDYFAAFSNGAAAAGRIIGATTDETLLVLRLLGQAGTLGLEAGTQVDIIFRDLGRAAVRSADEWKKYGLTANGTVTDQLVLLAELIERTGTNRIEQAKLRKELGLQEKSFRSISRIIPQIQNLGADTPARLRQIQREIQTTARNAEGTVGLQLDEQRKTVAFQFDQLLDSFKIAFQEFGEGASVAVEGLFDEFAGAGGLLERSLPQVREFGVAFGEIVQQVTDFVQTDNFLNGVETLTQAVQVTLSGFGDAFTEFSAAFNDGEKSASTFEAIADSILGFSRVAATVLPAVAKILGQIFDFLIDNADAFETFAKLTIGIFAVRKAYTLLIKPAGEALLAIDRVTSAVKLAAATGAGGLVVNALASVATRFGLIATSADAATASVTALTAAQVANARAANAGILAAGAADATRATRTGVGGRGLLALDAGVAATEIFSARSRNGSAAQQQKAAAGFAKALNAANPIADKATGRFGRLAAVFGKLVPQFVKASPALLRIGGAFAKFAGPIGLVVLAIEAGIGAVRGFIDEMKRGSEVGSDFGNSLKELQPIFDALLEGGKFLLDILSIVGRIGVSIGRLVATIVKQVIENAADSIRGVKLLFEGDLIGALKAFADVIVNTITLPFRLAISAVFDLLADAFESLKRIDTFLPGTPIKDAAESVRDAANSTRDFKLNLSEATAEATKTSAAVKEVDTNARAAALGVGLTTKELEKAKLSAEQLKIGVGGTFEGFRLPTPEVVSFTEAIGGFQAQIDVTGETAARAWGEQQLQAALAEDALRRFGNATANAFGGIYDGLRGVESGAGFAATQVGGIEGAFLSLKSSAAGATADIIANLSTVGQQAAIVNAQITQATNDAIALATAQLPAGETLSIDQQGIVAGLAALPITNPDLTRRQQLLAAVEQQRADRKFLEEALPSEDTPLTSSSPSSGGGSRPRASFVDPDDAIKAAIDRLQPARRIAETQAAIAKATAATDQSSARTKNALDGVAEGYQASRREVALFEAALPGLEKQLESQRTEVEALDEALTSLQNTQLKGTQAFSDQAFGIDQQVKALQLQKLDLEIAGATDGDPAITAIEEQIKSLQQQGERVSLVEALELDPLRRQLEATFNPTTEASFANIISQFKQLTAERAAAQANLEKTERTQQIISEVAEAGAARFDKLDEASRKAFERIQQSSATASTAIGTVGTTSATAARQVNRYSTAVENVPSGSGVVNRSLEGINKRIDELAPQFTNAGSRVITLFTQGVNRAASASLYPALATIVGTTLTYLRSTIPPAESVGERVMESFLDGLKAGFGTPKDKGSVAWYLNVFIPQWIKDNKGPVAYDATILVPAGQAVMEGFGKGLRDGFSQVQGFVKDVGPSLSEFISDEAFSGRVATVMADIAIGKTPDIDGVFGDLRASVEASTGGGTPVADPLLGFLHRTKSIRDTQLMAESLAKTFGTTGGVTTDRAAGAITSAGNLSAHPEGTAADIGTGGSQPTAASKALFAAIKPLLGNIFAEIIHNGRGFEAGGGSFPDGDHYDHVHAQWLKAAGFKKYSNQIGGPEVLNFPGSSADVDKAIAQAAAKYQFDPLLLGAMAFQESTFRPNVVSADGGYGLMQLTSKGYVDRARRMGDIFNPYINMDVGAFALRDKVNQNGGDLWAGVRDYNGGSAYPGIIREHMERFRKQFGGFRERGGPVAPDKSYIVGEKGPELFTPSSAGAIVNATDTARIMGQGSSQSMTYNDNRQITVETAATDPDAVAALVEMRTRTRLTGVNVR